ncbi:hypothetical protein FJTKL_02063 [Diaporthe vaccinii]|uniref:Uncharacterized protein n=1 Tax=Diaporthe vaccinii TaxID=105482 RepID=A0ABR4DZ59_9PEZI
MSDGAPSPTIGQDPPSHPLGGTVSQPDHDNDNDHDHDVHHLPRLTTLVSARRRVFLHPRPIPPRESV